MGVRLEELLIDFAANTASLDAAIDRSVAKARSAAGQIDTALGRSYGRKADLNLTPKVDHRHLDALNKHLDVKKRHFDEVQRHLQSSPLRVLVDDSQIKRSIQTARQLKRELDAGTRTRITAGGVYHASDQGDGGLVNSQIGQLLSLVRNLPKQIAKEIKEQTQPGIVGQALGGIGSLLSIPGRILGGVAQAGLTGLAIGATQPISGGVGKGVSQALEAAIGPKLGSSELIATKLTEAAIASLPAVGKDIGKAVSDTLDKFVPPAVKEKLAERVAPALQDVQQILQLLSEFTDESEKTVATLSQKNKQRLRQKSDKQAAREQATVEQREAFRDEVKTRVSNKKALADIERQQQETADALTKYRDLRERVNQISSDPGLEPLKALEFIEYAQNLNNYVADLEEFEQQLSEQQTKLQEKLAAAQKKSAAKKATFKSLEPPSPPQALVQVIDALTGGKGISEEEMPEIVADDEKLAGANARAAYTAQGNIIYATSELAAKLDQIRNMTEQEIYDLTHEVEHGIDAAFGSFEGIQAMKQGRVLGEKLTPDESEAAYIGKFTSLYKPEHQAQEQNAELAAMRAAPTLYKQAANQRLQSSVGRKGEIFEQKINNAVTNLIDQFSSIPKTDVLPPEIASQIDTEVQAIKKLLLFLGQTPQIVTQQLQSGKPLEPSEIERIETTIESIANKVVATQERIVAISNQATTALQSHLLTTAGDLWTGEIKSTNLDFSLVPPAPVVEDPTLDQWVGKPLEIPLKPIEPSNLESINVEIVPEVAVAESLQIDLPLDISAINIPTEKLIDVETGILEQIQQSINQDAVNAAVEQAQVIAANFAQAGASAAAGVKSDPGMAQAYAQAIQNTAEQAKADIALVVETLGEEAAFGTRAGNQLAQAKGQVVIAENKAKRAEAIATPKQVDPSVAPALQRVNELSQVFKNAGGLLAQAVKTNSTEAVAIARDIKDASGEIRAELDAILSQVNTGEIRKAIGLLRTQITKSVNKAESFLGDDLNDPSDLERQRFGLGTVSSFIAKYGTTTTGNTDSIAQGADRLSSALARLDAISETRGLPGVAAEIVTQPLTKDLLVNAAGVAGSQLGAHLGVAPELAGDLVGALLARQGVHAGTTAIAAQQQLVGTAEFESADLFGKLNQVLKKTIELLQSQQVQTGLGKELTGDLLGWGIGNGSAIGLNALGQIHPALSVAAAVPMKGAAVAAAVVPRVQGMIERQAAANVEPDEYERYRLEDDDGGKNLGYLAKEASKAYENLEWTLQSIKKWLPDDAQAPAIASEVETQMQQFRTNTEQLLAAASRVYGGETFNPQILKHLTAAAEAQIAQFKAYEQQLQEVRKALVAAEDAASRGKQGNDRAGVSSAHPNKTLARGNKGAEQIKQVFDGLSSGVNQSIDKLIVKEANDQGFVVSFKEIEKIKQRLKTLLGGFRIESFEKDLSTGQKAIEYRAFKGEAGEETVNLHPFHARQQQIKQQVNHLENTAQTKDVDSSPPRSRVHGDFDIEGSILKAESNIKGAKAKGFHPEIIAREEARLERLKAKQQASAKTPTTQKVEQEIKDLEKSAGNTISQVNQDLQDGLTNIATQVELAQNDLATKLAPLGQQADQTVSENQLSDFATRLNALTERLAKLKAIADAAAAINLENAQQTKVLEARQLSLDDPWTASPTAPGSPVFASGDALKFPQIEDPWAEIAQASQQATDSIQANLNTIAQSAETTAEQINTAIGGAIIDALQKSASGLTQFEQESKQSEDTALSGVSPRGQVSGEAAGQGDLTERLALAQQQAAQEANSLTNRLQQLKQEADADANALTNKLANLQQQSAEESLTAKLEELQQQAVTEANALSAKLGELQQQAVSITPSIAQISEASPQIPISQKLAPPAPVTLESDQSSISHTNTINEDSLRTQLTQINQVSQAQEVIQDAALKDQEKFENTFLGRWQQFWQRVSGVTQLDISSGFDLRGLDSIEKKLWQGIVQTLKGAEAAADDFDAAFSQAQKNVDQSLAASSAAINQQLQDLEDLSATGEESIDLFGKAFGKFGSVLDDVLEGILALFGIITLGDAIVNIGQSTFQTALEMERLKTALDFTTEGKGIETLKQLTAQADELGVSFRKSAEGYLQLSAALLGTNLQNQTDTLFTGISEAISTRSLSSEQQERVFLAISQSASKGKISLEELSQQLSENLTGSLNIAARAMGMTTAELIDLVETGNLMSETFLPKFAAQLSLESKSGLAAAADTAQAKLNRLNNAIERLQAALGGFTLEAAKGGIDATAGAVNSLADNADNLIRVAEILALFLGIKLTQALYRLVGGFIAARLGGLSLIGILLRLGTAARVAFSAFIVPAAIATGIEIIIRSFERGSDTFNEATRGIQSNLKRIVDEMEKTGRASEELKRKLKIDPEQIVSKDPVLRGADRIFGATNQLLGKTPFPQIGRWMTEKFTGQKSPETYTFAEAEKQDILNRTQESLNKHEIFLGLIKNVSAEDAKATAEQLRNQDLVIAKTQARLNVLKTENGSQKEIADTEKELLRLQDERNKTAQSGFGVTKGQYETQIQELEKLKKAYEEYRDNPEDPIEESEAIKQLEIVQAKLDETKRKWQIIEDAEKAAGVQVDNFRAKVVALDATFTNKLSQNERALTQAQTNILQLQAQGALGENAARQASLSAEADAYNQKLGYLKDYVSAYQAEIGKLSQTDRSQLEQYLGKSLDTAEAGDIAKVEELYKEKLTTNQEAALNARKKVIELQQQMDETAGQIATSAIELRTSLRDTEDQAREMQRSVEDFVRGYDDFIRGIVDQTKDAALDIESLKNQIRTNDFKADLLRALTKTSRGIFGTINDVMLRYLDEANQIAQAGLDGTRQQMQLQDQIRSLLQQNQQQGQQSEDIGRQVGRFNEANAGGSASGIVFPVVGRTATEKLPGPNGMMAAMRDGGRRRHNGIDYQYGTGTALVAPFSGTVDRIDQHRGEYQVILKGIDEQGRKIQLSMAHLAEIFVKAGDQLTVGQALGKVGGDKGSWGSTGAHLDLKVKVNGQVVDPRDFFAQSVAANPNTANATSTVNNTMTRLLHIIAAAESSFNPRAENTDVPVSRRPRGAFQFIPGTRQRAIERTGLDPWAGDVSQQAAAAAAWIKAAHPKAYAATQQGNLDQAIALLRNEWTSLPGAAENMKWRGSKGAAELAKYKNGNFTSRFTVGGAAAQTTTASAPQLAQPQIDLSQGDSAIARLEQTQAEINQLNERLRQQQLEQFGINYNREITAFIEQRSDAFKQQRLALRELMEQQSDFKQQYQKESIAGTIAQEMTSIERSFRGLRESYEQESISLQKDIAGAEELLKTIPEQIAKLRASGRPEDSILAQGQERVLKDIQDNYAKYQERLQQIRSEHEKLRDEGQAAINFTVGEKLRQATEEGNDALRSLQRSMRDAGQEYADLMDQFAAPTFARELAKALTDVDRSFEGMGDNLGDRNLELTRQIQELEAQLQSTGTELANMVAVGDVNAYALVQLQDQQQAKLAELLAALAQNQTQQARLPYDQRTARFVKQMQVTRQTRQEREQNLVDTEANFLESRAGVIAQRDEYGAAKVEAQAALIQENLRFKVEMKGFDELAAKLNYTAEEAATAKQQLSEINSINLENIRQQADLLGKQLREGIGSSFESFFQDLIMGGKAFNEVISDLIGSMAQFLAQLAAQALVKSLFGGIFGGGGTVGAFAFGGTIRNYAQGGDVMALGMAVTAAMRREGPQAVPIVASVGEEVLSTRTGDAQFYRSLKERGVWNDLKVNNYADGGSVGNFASAPYSVVRSPSKGGDTIIPVTVQYQAAAGEDEATSRARAGQLAGQLRAVVQEEMVKQSRNGGILNR